MATLCANFMGARFLCLGDDQPKAKSWFSEDLHGSLPWIHSALWCPTVYWKGSSLWRKWKVWREKYFFRKRKARSSLGQKHGWQDQVLLESRCVTGHMSKYKPWSKWNGFGGRLCDVGFETPSLDCSKSWTAARTMEIHAANDCLHNSHPNGWSFGNIHFSWASGDVLKILGGWRW